VSDQTDDPKGDEQAEPVNGAGQDQYGILSEKIALETVFKKEDVLEASFPDIVSDHILGEKEESMG
jgi:hypothetical protein